LVGKINDVVPSPENPERWLIQFSEYAEISVPNVWGKGWRNPVRYTTLEDLGINPAHLEFKPMPDAVESEKKIMDADAQEDEKSLRLTIAEAKEGLSAAFGVPVEAIEITIRA